MARSNHRKSFFVPVEQLQKEVAQIVAGVEVTGVDGISALVFPGQRLLETASRPFSESARSCREGTLIGFGYFVRYRCIGRESGRASSKRPGVVQQHRALVGGACRCRGVSLSACRKLRSASSRSFQVEQDIAEVFPEFAHVGLELHPALSKAFSASPIVPAVASVAEAHEVFGFWDLPDGTGDPLDRVIVLLVRKATMPIRCSVSAWSGCCVRACREQASASATCPAFRKLKPSSQSAAGVVARGPAGDLRGFSATVRRW